MRSANAACTFVLKPRPPQVPLKNSLFQTPLKGHVGAQVAIHRHRAVGAKLEVYWPLDQKWFPGIVRLKALCEREGHDLGYGI